MEIATVGVVDSKGHLELEKDPKVWIKNNPASRLAFVTSLTLKVYGVEEIGESICELTHLIRLQFRWCRSLKRVPNAITWLHKLEHLLFHDCYRLEELPANIGNLVSLTHLQLSHCHHIKYLPNTILNLSSLTSLYLSHCDCLVELPANIGQLVSLTQLKLDSCENIKSLPMSIANLSNLTSLSLEYCDSLTELPSNIGQMKSLSHLELNKCNKIKSLPDSMKDLCSLDTLIINECNSLTHLPINLNVLHLKLIDCCPCLLPTGLINLKYLEVTVYFNLQHLSISTCCMHRIDIITLPACLNQFINLQVLSLHGYDEIRFVELPANLDGLAHLCLLDIQYSSIRCLPWSITKLRKLRHLMLPEYFRLETLPYDLNDSVIISVKSRHVRKSLGELKTEIGQLLDPFGGEKGNDAARNPFITSPPGYLLLDGYPWHWNVNNNDSQLVRFLDLEYDESTDSIAQFTELTHLYLYNSFFLDYFVTLTRLTQLYLDCPDVEIDKSTIHSLSKLSNLKTLHLDLCYIELPENFSLPVSVTSLSLLRCNELWSLSDSLAKLSNLKILNLDHCQHCESLPPYQNLDKLRLIDCYFKSFPIGLHHLEILFFKVYRDLGSIFEKCCSKLVNLETLSITCSKMKFLPEEIARLRNLQKLQLKDCVSLKKLPSNLHELVNLHTLDISVTGIKTLPLIFVKQCKLQHLTLPKCFNVQCLPRKLKNVSIIDDTEEAYYKREGYDASLYQTSADSFDESEETELGVVPRESCNEDNNVVPTVELHEIVPDDQTFADPFNSTSTCHIGHITTEQGGVSQIYKDSHSYVSKDPIDENLQHSALYLQNQFNPLGNGGFMTYLPGACSFGVNNQHAINGGHIGTMTLESELGIVPIYQHVASCDGNSFIGDWNNDHALEFGHNDNTSQTYDADANAIREGREITQDLEAIVERLPTNMRLVDAPENLDGFYSSRRENSNPEGESIPATHTDQNDIMTTEIEQGNGDYSRHDSENEENQIPQNNYVKGKKGKEITLETLQPFWSKNMTLEEAANKIGIGRSTLKRRLKKLGVKWPRKGTKQHLDAKKRKLNNKAPFGSDCSQQNLVNLGNSAADHAENVEEHIMGSDLHTLPNHVSSNSNVVINLTPDATMETIRGNSMETIRGNLMETIRGKLMEIIDSHQGAEVNLDGANEHTLSDTLPQNEKSSNFIVKATYKDDTIRFDFSLSKSIDQLKKEVGKRLDIEVSTFKLKYQDEEKEWILLTCISDLEHALNLSRSSNDTNVGSVVRLLVVLKA